MHIQFSFLFLSKHRYGRDFRENKLFRLSPKEGAIGRFIVAFKSRAALNRVLFQETTNAKSETRSSLKKTLPHLIRRTIFFSLVHPGHLIVRQAEKEGVVIVGWPSKDRAAGRAAVSSLTCGKEHSVLEGSPHRKRFAEEVARVCRHFSLSMQIRVFVDAGFPHLNASERTRPDTTACELPSGAGCKVGGSQYARRVQAREKNKAN